MKQWNESSKKMEGISLREYARQNFNSGVFAERDEEHIKQELAGSTTLLASDNEIRRLARLILAEEKNYLSS